MIYKSHQTLPAWTYTSDAFLELEKRHLFLNNWQLICHSSDIPNSGDYFTFNFFNERLVASVQIEAWGLPPTASARFALMANPGSETGFIRLIDFDGVEQVRIRSHDQPWETGGIFNNNMRVSDMA